MSLASTLLEELRVIGLAPADITFLAFSHLSFRSHRKCQRVSRCDLDHQ